MLTVVFVVYVAVVVAIGLWSAKKSKTDEDFILGGGKLSGISLAFSERATGESAWLLLGLTGHAYAEGISSIWVALGCVTGILFIWFAMARKLRSETENTGALTLPGLLSKKFPGSQRSIGILSAVIIIFFFLFYIAAQFSGAGTVLEKTFGMDPTLGILIGSLVVTLYCLLGGFIAVVATDVIQSILMIATLVILPIAALIFAAGHSVSISAALRDAGPALNNLTAGQKGLPAILFILSGMSWALGYTGQPQLLTRMMAIRKDSEVKSARAVAAIWTVVAYAGALLIGMAGYALVKAGALGADTAALAENAEGILPIMIMGLLSPILAGILLSGAISAMMSTADSELLVCSSSASRDVYHNIRSEKSGGKKMLLITRIMTLSVSALALLAALFMQETVYSFVSYAWAGLGSSFGPALVLLLFWKKFSRAGLFASLICGSVGTVVWKNFLAVPTGVSERLGSYVFAFLMAVAFSLLLPEKRREA